MTVLALRDTAYCSHCAGLMPIASRLAPAGRLMGWPLDAVKRPVKLVCGHSVTIVVKAT